MISAGVRTNCLSVRTATCPEATSYDAPRFAPAATFAAGPGPDPAPGRPGASNVMSMVMLLRPPPGS